MITVKLFEVVNAKDAIAKLISMHFNAKLSYQINRMLSKMNPFYVDFEKAREGVIKRLGSEKDGNWSVDPDKHNQFISELKEMLDESVEIDYNKINLSSVLESMELTPSDIAYLEPFFDFE